MTLKKLDPVLKSVLSKGQVAILGLDSSLYNCLVCLTKRLGKFPGRLVYLGFCHCMFLPFLTRSCLRCITGQGQAVAPTNRDLSFLALTGLYRVGRSCPSSSDIDPVIRH